MFLPVNTMDPQYNLERMYVDGVIGTTYTTWCLGVKDGTTAQVPILTPDHLRLTGSIATVCSSKGFEFNHHG